jgi:rare lipoprotein A
MRAPPRAEAPPPPPKVTPNPAYKVGNPYQVAGLWYYPREQPDYDETGIASWYGSQFHGMLTADGEVFDRTTISAAHPTLPMPVNVRVTNLENGRSIVVRVNDRGPFVNGRIIDLSEKAADLLGYRIKGTARVRVTYLGRADLYGPGPAPPSQETPVEIASAVPAAPTMMVDEMSLPPVAGAGVAPPRQVASLPMPMEQIFMPPAAQIPDGQIQQLPVPATTAIYVQAGAFSSVQNAGSVAARLSGVGARVYPAVKDGKPIYRVRIGPFQNVDEADAALNQVLTLGHNDVQIVVDGAMG